MDEERRRALETLLELCARVDNTGCWDRAEDLLRANYSADELKEAGVSAAVVERLFPEEMNR